MKLANVISRQIKGFWGESAASDSGIPVIKTNNLTYRGFIDYADISYRNIPINKIGVNFLQKGDLLIEKSGGTKTHSVGYVNYFDSSENKFVCNNFILGLRPDQSFVESKYLFYQLRWMYENGRFEDCCNKTTGIQNLKIGDYLQKEIIIPSRDKQNEIVKQLDNVETLISNSESKLLLFDELVKSRFIEMFGDPIENILGWEKYPLGERCTIITGNTPSRADANNYGSYLEWIKSDNINTSEAYLTHAQECLSEKGFKKCRYVESGSILMTCIAGSVKCIGNVGIANRRVAFNQQINAIVPVQDETMYIYWLMKLSQPYIQSTISMSLKGILSKSQLSALEFPFPPIDQQRAFSVVAQQVDKSKLVIKKSLSELEELRDSLMQKYFFD